MWVLRALAALAASVAASLLPLDAEQLHASVGGFAVMNCHLDFPFGNEIPYHLQWDKDVSTSYVFYRSSTTRANSPLMQVLAYLHDNLLRDIIRLAC